MTDCWRSSMTDRYGTCWEPVFALMAPLPGRDQLARYYAVVSPMLPGECADQVRVVLDLRPDLRERQ